MSPDDTDPDSRSPPPSASAPESESDPESGVAAASTTVEAATMADAERVATLWVALAQSQREHGSLLLGGANRPVVLDSMRRRIVAGEVLVARSTPESETVHAECDGDTDADTVVGFVSFTRTTDDFQRSANKGVIENLYVVPARRDAGIGAALLAAAERTLDVEMITLEAMADNTAARRFYRRQGYQPHRVTLAKPTEAPTDATGSDTPSTED